MHPSKVYNSASDIRLFGTTFLMPVKLVIVYKAFIAPLVKIMTRSTMNGLVMP